MSRVDDFDSRVDRKIETLTDRKKEQVDENSQDDLESRIEYLKTLKKQYHEERTWRKRLRDRRVFISFAGQQGNTLMERCYTAIRNIRGNAFSVVTGMGTHGEPLVTTHIASRIAQCFLFVGILTKEQQLSSGRWVPGAWVQVEAGMALAHDLQIVLMYDREIDEQSWKTIFGHIRQIAFTEQTFAARLDTLQEFVQENYEYLVGLHGSPSSS